MTMFNLARAGLCVVVLLSGCSAAPRAVMSTDYDAAVDFSALQTYAWQDPDLSEAELSGLDLAAVDGMIRTAVDRELAAKGYTKAPEGEADFWVVYDASVQQKVEVVPVIEPGTTGSGSDWAVGGGGGGATTSTEVREYQEGTVMLYVVEPAAIRPIWQCLHQNVIRRSGTVDERRIRVNAAVADMLASFPP